MRKFMMALGAASLILPAAVVIPGPGDKAEARKHYSRQYRGRDTRINCKKHGGTTGLVVGGLAGGLLGNKILGGTTGTVVGAAGGALGGRALERGGSNDKRC